MLLAYASEANAVPYFWDIDGAIAGAGGGTTPNGTWSSGGTTLSTSSAGTLATGAVTTVNGDTLTFSAGVTATGSYTVTVSGTQTISTLTFEDGTPSLTGDTIDFRTGAVATSGTITANVDADIANVIAGGAGAAGTGSGGMLKTGTSTLTLSGTGTNTYPSQFLVTAGTLNLHGIHTDDGVGRNLRLRGTSTLNLYGTETIAGTSTMQLGETTAGTQNLNVYGTLNLSATNDTIIGQVTASTSTLTVKSGGVVDVGSTMRFILGNSTGTVTNGILTIESGGSMTLNGAGGANPFILGRNNANASGVVNLDGGTLSTGRSIRGSNIGGAGKATINFNGGTLRAIDTNNAAWVNPSLGSSVGNGKAIVELGGAIFDTNGFNMGIPDPLEHDTALGATPDGGLTKNGGGILTLSNNANTYTGDTTVNAGTLKLTTTTNNNINSSPLIQLTTVGSVLDVTSVSGSGGFKLASGQTLQGIGSVTGNVSSVGGGIYAPGNSPGLLTINGDKILVNNDVYEWEVADDGVAGVDYDSIDVNGNLNVTAVTAGGIDLQFIAFGSPYFHPSTEFALWTYDDLIGWDTGTGVNNPSGLFTFVNLAGFPGNPIVYDDGAGTIWLTGIGYTPEPASFALAAFGVVCFGFVGRRRNRCVPNQFSSTAGGER